MVTDGWRTVRGTAVRETLLANLEARFGSVPADQVAAVNAITDEKRLRELHKLLVTCPDLAAFVAALSAPPQ